MINSAKLLLKNDRKIKTMPDEQKLMKYITTRLTIQEMLQELLYKSFRLK